MISHLLLVLGVGVLTAALRSFSHPVLRRLGTLGVGATSFLVGWLLGGSVWLGAVLAASWLLLPWLEILTRVRAMRIPADRLVGRRSPPLRSEFPAFGPMTDAIEECGFEQLDDVGWEFDTYRNFHRVFADTGRRLQAAICLVEHHGLAFYYLTVTSRTADGRIMVTWNYPFSYGLKFPPTLQLNRVTGGLDFPAIVAAHEAFLRESGVSRDECQLTDADDVTGLLQAEMRAQLAHNLHVGVLCREGEDTFRYTVRGMFFLWLQFLRDLIRLP